jgi:hypothetical protein
MTSRYIPGSLTGLIAGVIVIGVIFILEIGKILPQSVAGVFLAFAGGLAAGLFTHGSIVKGALTGVVCGLLVITVMVTRVFGMMDPMGGVLPIWSSIGAFTIIIAVIFVPFNTIGGIMGVAIRRWYRQEPLSDREGSQESGMNQRSQWTGIVIGACLVAGSSLLIGSLNMLQIIPPLAAGSIAGFLSPGGIRNGIASGFITAMIGIGILAVPTLWVALTATGFSAGLAGIALIVVAVIAIPMAIIGGMAAVVIRERLFPSTVS